ncbi:MAG: hypothetical protein CL583_16470 [Alteromonadaceae bacterium]|nr:hypothetical protein [Alteromonadaceae bacterium]
MGSIWREGSEKHQHIVTAILGAPGFSLIYHFFTRNFVAEPKVLIYSIYISAALTAAFVAFLTNLYFKKLWNPATAWVKYSKLKNALLAPLIPLAIFALFWVTLAISAPQVFTVLFGVEAVKQALVEKQEGYSRRSCDHRLVLKSINTILFRYCISAEYYSELPDGEIVAELVIKQSVFGYTVEDIKLPHDNVRK